MAFDNVQFPLSVHSFTSAPEFNTTIIPTGSGAEQRIANWVDGRVYFNAAMGVRSKVDLQALISFFRARKGRARGFLVKDLLDFEAKGDVVAVGTGAISTYQLQRVYTDIATSLAYGVSGNSDIRPVYKPIPGTVTVYAGAAGLTPLVAGGYGAYATATITGGAITAVTLSNGGSGYTSNPSVIVTGGGGSGAVITATATAGAVTSFGISNGGSGFTSTPTLTVMTANGDYSIDYKTGIIRLVSNLTTGHILNWFGEFYIPCRFTEDRLPADEVYFDMIENKAAGNIPDVGMQEIRDFE